MGAHHPRHSHRAASLSPQERRLHRWMLSAIAPLAVLSLVAMVWMWPDPVAAPDGPGALDQVAGTVQAIDPEPCAEELPDDVNGCGTAVVLFTDGDLEGEQQRVPLPNGQGAPELDEGDDVVLIATDTPDGTSWAVVDHQRGTQLWILGLAFAVALVAFGRWRGLSALVGLAVTFLVLVLFVVPAILGGDPIDYSYKTQAFVAVRLKMRSGSSPWPSCG